MKTQRSKKSEHYKIAFIQAGWHEDIVEQSLLAFMQTLNDSKLLRYSVELFRVPGSLEIPLKCQIIANSNEFDIIVAAGLIVDGGIYRHDFVASTVLDGMMQVQLSTYTPILSIVLTPHHFNDKKEHHDFFFEHFKVKGKEAAYACLQVLENTNSIVSSHAA